ncbi:MAG: hypothetical protein IJK89_12885 [Clostridia bacterium]|nr:hypothetical protein [Clostridia bacterium]
MKTRMLALLFVAALLFSRCACGSPKKDDAAPTDAATGSAEETTAEAAAEPVAADISGWTWAKAELDCYGYDTGGVDCYLSFDYPDQFKAEERNDSGEQYRGYHFNPANPDATANEATYGIYAYFMQGGYGGNKSSFEETLPNGFQERELGGRTVLFGELQQDPNTGSHAFVYYASYSEDDWARIWVILTDPEADGAFRQAFEQSMSFSK